MKKLSPFILKASRKGWKTFFKEGFPTTIMPFKKKPWRSRSSLARRRILLVLTGAIVTALLLSATIRILSKPKILSPSSKSSQVTKPQRQTEKPLPPRQPYPKPSYRMAIIIDDIGYNLATLDKFLKLNANLTFSVLPDAPYARESAERIVKAGRELMVHLPMEPLGDEPGYLSNKSLLTTMSDEEIKKTLLEFLEILPQAKGVNNHMGSKFTTDEHAMKITLEVIKSRGLFFIDSRTNSHSVAFNVAKSLGLRTAISNGFLDNFRSKEKIEEHLDALALNAITGGKALGIGHPYTITLEVLAQKLPLLKQKGIELVAVSRLLE